MVEVVALHSFTHNGKSYKRNAVWDESPALAEALRRAGLVRLMETQATPRQGPGKKSSASPVVPVSPKQTSKSSRRGAKGGKAEASSSPTPPSE